eukprot:TRINITY_DN59052_c0_g1_i1.p1 TRINITY_DN59052_c0_g1~~TRINITY_DN59052_c0_g1_i1.p1  ORF type:complete len:421 (+),score=69.20 TRINITY_DN59052_c0_g1_i1:89-1351(+)
MQSEDSVLPVVSSDGERVPSRDANDQPPVNPSPPEGDEEDVTSDELPDEYGFVHSNSTRGGDISHPPSARHERHVAKWRDMIANWEKFAVQRTGRHARAFQRRVRKGIPKVLRGTVWCRLLGATELKLRNPTQYLRILSVPIGKKDTSQIALDLGRTLPANIHFHEHGPGQAALRNVLTAWCAYYAPAAPESTPPAGAVPVAGPLDPSAGAAAAAAPTTSGTPAASPAASPGKERVGYTQGMGYLVAMLLLHMPEDDAFWSLVALMKKRDLQGMFSDRFPMLHLLLAQFEDALTEHAPQHAKVLQKCGLEPIFYAVEWFMKAFVGDLPVEAVARVWSIWFHDGDEKILLRTAVALVRMTKLPSVAPDDPESQKAVKEAIKRTALSVDPDRLIDAAFAVKMRRDRLALIRTKHFAQDEKKT